MNNDSISYIIILIIMFFLLGIWLGAMIEQSVTHTNQEVIKHGCAEYNQTTGNFQWKEK